MPQKRIEKAILNCLLFEYFILLFLFVKDFCSYVFFFTMIMQNGSLSDTVVIF